MKKTLLALLAALLITSCGANRGANYKDPELTIVVLEVANDLENRGVDTSRIYKNVDSWEFDNAPYDNLNGRCEHGAKDSLWNMAQVDTGSHVYINRYYWERLTSLEKKALIAHEVVGHCAWGQEHTKRGIMQPTPVYVPTQNGYDNVMDNFASTLK